MFSEIQFDIAKIEGETVIFESGNYSARTNALDFIEFHIIDRIKSLSQQFGECDELIELRKQANRLIDKLENIDVEMFQRLDQQISISKNKGFEIRRILEEFSKDLIDKEDRLDANGYDNLDIFLNRLLSTNTIKEVNRELEPEMVFYQKTPAKVIIELSKRVKRDDVFYDIGSGIGQVVILVNLICNVTAIGIEFEPVLCDHATAIVSKLELKCAYFINEDARNVDFSKGTVFFLYTPFVGKMMQDVLAIIRKISQKKEIRIFTYGPCSTTINKQNWLKCINGSAENIDELYEFISLPLKNL